MAGESMAPVSEGDTLYAVTLTSTNEVRVHERVVARVSPKRLKFEPYPKPDRYAYEPNVERRESVNDDGASVPSPVARSGSWPTLFWFTSMADAARHALANVEARERRARRETINARDARDAIEQALGEHLGS